MSHMSKAYEFCVEWCFPVQIVRKHGVLWVKSELEIIACIANHHPPPPPQAPMFFLEVQKVDYIEVNQMLFDPSISVGNLPR